MEILDGRTILTMAGEAEMSQADNQPVTVTVGGGAVHAPTRGESSLEPLTNHDMRRARADEAARRASDGKESRDVDGGEVPRAATKASYPIGWT
jgi:hypothetical protein